MLEFHYALRYAVYGHRGHNVLKTKGHKTTGIRRCWFSANWMMKGFEKSLKFMVLCQTRYHVLIGIRYKCP